MNRKIKFIWDFYGEDAQKTAEHHAIHLNEFATKHSITPVEVGTDKEQQSYYTFMIVSEERMIEIRDTLRPKRVQWVESN